MGFVAEPALRAFGLAAGEKWTHERVLSVHRWTPALISFRTTRSPEFVFRPGHYTRVGVGKTGHEGVWRPLSLASGVEDKHLEFFAVLIPGGELSAELEKLQVNDSVRIDKRTYGFLMLDQLAPGNDLWLLATGTGLAPFISMLREPSVWRDFQRIIVVHSVRHADELAYRDEIHRLAKERRPGDNKAQLIYLPVVTREPGATALDRRIPLLIADGSLESAAGMNLGVEASRLMVCGNPEMTRELRLLLGARGFLTSRRGVPGQMAFEKYW